jgi:malonate transporter
VLRQPHALVHPAGRAVASAALEALPGAGDDKTIGLLADAASPVALFTIGAVLARSQMNGSTSTMARCRCATTCRWCWPSCWCTRCWCGARARRPCAAGRAAGPFALTVLVLVAALPSASNVSLLAERFGADNGPHRPHHPAVHGCWPS